MMPTSSTSSWLWISLRNATVLSVINKSLWSCLSSLTDIFVGVYEYRASPLLLESLHLSFPLLGMCLKCSSARYHRDLFLDIVSSLLKHYENRGAFSKDLVLNTQASPLCHSLNLFLFFYSCSHHLIYFMHIFYIFIAFSYS